MAEQLRNRVGIDDLQQQVDAALKLGSAESPPALHEMLIEEGAPQPSRRFSAFHLPDVQRAKELAAEWMNVAEEVRGSSEDPAEMRVAVGAALEKATGAIAEMETAPDLDANLARHAVKLFLTHYQHELPLRIHGLEAREPWLVMPSRNGDGPPATANPEESLRWFREDPKLNDPKRLVFDLEAKRALPTPVTLAQVKADAVLKTSDLARLPRLSVMPLSDAQFQRLLKLAGA